MNSTAKIQSLAVKTNKQFTDKSTRITDYLFLARLALFHDFRKNGSYFRILFQQLKADYPYLCSAKGPYTNKTT